MQSRQMLLQVLIVGRTERAEFAPLTGWMSQSLQPARLQHHADLGQAVAFVAAANWIPDLVIVAQSWPDEYSRPEIDLLRQQAPLARWVVLCGAWCESDGRTRDLWPKAVQIRLASAASRLRREWQLLSGEPVAPLPMSASREETFAFDYRELKAADNPATVLIHSPDPDYRQFLKELLTSAGHETVDIASCAGSPLDAMLLDVDPWDDERREIVRDVLSRRPQVRAIALMNQPAPEITADLRALGIAEVLPRLDDQQRLLDAVSGRRTLD